MATFYKQTLRRKAHSFGMIAAVWTLFSLFGVFDWRDGHHKLSFDPNNLFGPVLWGIHLVFVSLAVYFSRTEKTKPILCISEDAGSRLVPHLCVFLLVANLPVLALWHGSLAVQIAVHILLLLLGIGGLALLRRAQTTRTNPQCWRPEPPPQDSVWPPALKNTDAR